MTRPRGRSGGWVAGAAALAAVLLAPVLRGRLLTWGASDDEVAAALAGDATLSAADVVATRAIGIDAPTGQVWPWIAQLGQGRGGLYSYDALENLVGCRIHSSRRIVPEWQDIARGDEVRLHPDSALIVAGVDRGRVLVLAGAAAPGAPAPPYDFTWAFVVQERPGGGSRLIVRERYAYRRPSAAPLVEIVSVVSWFMTQRMLRGIKERAERTATAQPSSARV